MNIKSEETLHLTLSDRFYKTGREFLNVDYPIICGAMTWISEPNLVAAVANAGGFG
jgi:enoyl-[acyl-carrier protein] reductase II